MSKHEVDEYLAGLDEPKRATLNALRATLAKVVPEAEEGIAYGSPAFKVGGKAVAGFAAYKDHLSYLPHSGSVLGSLGDQVDGYECSKGALKFAVDTPLPERLVRTLVTARKQELGLT